MTGTFDRPDPEGSTVLQRGAYDRWALVDDLGGYIEADAGDFVELEQ